MKKRNMKKTSIIAIILFSTIVATSSCSTVRSFRIIAPSLFGTNEIEDGIYLDDEITEKQKEELYKSINISKKRLAKFYGILKTRPGIIACATEDRYKQFGGISAKGKNYGSIGILLSPRGINSEIISHEWSHRELFERLGYFNHRKIAYWFDEGLAVYISGDEQYSHDRWEQATENGKTAPGLDELETLTKWLKANREKDHILSYGTAREEVARWLNKAGVDGLRELLNRLSKGEDFYSAYFSIAKINSTFLERKTYNKINAADAKNRAAD
jgi:hypothetical protein